MQVVWFKRDLRVQDHAPLARAAQNGPVLPLYVVEPELWAQPDAAGRHWAYITQCLQSLRADLAHCGQPLVLRQGEITEVLAQLAPTALFSHEETGNAWSYARDRRVAAWCKAHGIPWHQFRQFGVERGPSNRNGWAKRWDKQMGEPVVAIPTLAPLDIDTGEIPPQIGVANDPCPQQLVGGRERAEDRLHSFLTERGLPYRKAMSTPAEGALVCSRLSADLAYGTMSVREVAQATWARQQTAPPGWKAPLRSFNGRLHWHCHFIQKLEDAPQIETRNLHPAHDGLRGDNGDHLAAWQKAETGLPFVDACMRCLAATGWMNFRMRAMLMAVASYHLWLDWRAPGLHLARRFTDYEPGIHWPQVQMQSGTTGVNTIRVYNPVKQGLDQDPQGAFTRKWVPELGVFEGATVHEPWKSPHAAQVLGKTYPFPVVDYLEAAKQARQKLWAMRGDRTFRAKAGEIQQQHGSRKSGIPMRGRRKSSCAQLSFDLGEP